MVKNPETTHSCACYENPPSYNRKRWQAQSFPIPNLATEGSLRLNRSSTDNAKPTPTNRILQDQPTINQSREIPSPSLQGPPKAPFIPVGQKPLLSYIQAPGSMALGNFLLKIPPATPQKLSKPKSLQSTGTAKPKQGDLTADLNKTQILPML